jgi:3-oxoadipate enol-lactonase
VTEAPRLDVHGRSDAPVLVLAGSVGSLPSMWNPQLAAFAADFRVVRLTHLGHGPGAPPPGPYSIDGLADDALALLDDLGVESFAWCGLSLGAMVGMAVAAAVPHRVRRLALCCSLVQQDQPDAWRQRAATVRAEGLPAIADLVIARWFTPAFAAERPDLVRRLRETFVGLPAEGYAACCDAISELDLVPLLGRISAPTLVLAGADDPAVPREQSERTAAGIDGARLAVVPAAAHLATVEQPRQTTRILLDHLKGHR